MNQRFLSSQAAYPNPFCLDAMEPPPPPPPPELVSDVLEEIFLLLASPADLARASAACVSFHRLISSASFLRRYRSVHPPPLLGFVDGKGFHPVYVDAAHPSSPVVARSVDMSFLPQMSLTHDVRDGLVLAGCKYWKPRRRSGRCPCKNWDLAVCDPVSQRYLPLPPLTDDLLASVGLCDEDLSYSDASLIPPSASGGGMEVVVEEETSFRVIYWILSKTRLVVFIFSTRSAEWGWAAVKSISWADLDVSEEKIDGGRPSISGQCAHSCFYWKVYCKNRLIKLDMKTMEFSKYDLPPYHSQRSIAIVESGEGEVVMFSTLGKESVEYYSFVPNGADDKSYKWHLKGTVPSPAHGPSHFFINGQAEGYVFLAHVIKEQDKEYLEYFSLEVKSCNIERACRISGRILSYPYFGFPKSMSPRRIQGYGEVCKS